jgi:hypothetical protein
MSQDDAEKNQDHRDFFMSYVGQDRPWAEWIAAQLDAAGYTFFLQAWDVRPGSNFVVEMDQAAKLADRTLIVLSAAYQQSGSARSEWAAAFRQDPTGSKRQLLPVRIEMCALDGLLAQISFIDLVGSGAEQAKERLLTGIQTGRVRPEHVPFPGKPVAAVAFPGSSSDEQRTGGKGREAIQTIRALFLAANPASTNRLAIDEEMRAIEQKVRASEYRDVLVFQSAWAVRRDDLLQLLNQHRPQIVHFSGHGSHAGLSLSGDDGQERLVTTRALTALFATLKDNIRLVFLNACYSHEQAQALITSIDCVIGMKESIRDDAAAIFASSFYRAIGFGRSIQEACDQGKTALLLEDIPEEDIPELLVKDGVDPARIVLIGHPANPL